MKHEDIRNKAKLCRNQAFPLFCLSVILLTLSLLLFNKLTILAVILLTLSAILVLYAKAWYQIRLGRKPSLLFIGLKNVYNEIWNGLSIEEIKIFIINSQDEQWINDFDRSAQTDLMKVSKTGLRKIRSYFHF